MADNFNFKDIAEAICSNLETTNDDFEKAHLMRLDAFTSFHETASKSESVAGEILEEYLENYTQLVSGNTINNYANEVQEMLGSSTKNPSAWEFSLDIDDVDKFLPTFSKCKGKYQDCEFDELTDDDIEKFNFSMKTENEKSSMKFSNDTSKEDNNKFNVFLNNKEDPPSSLNIPSTSKQNIFYPSKNQTNDENPFQPSTSGFNERQSFSNNKIQSKKLNDNQSSDSDLPYENKSLFRTAADELHIQNMKKNMGNQSSHQSQQVSLTDYGMSKKSLGGRRNVKRNFVPPVKKDLEEVEKTDENLKNVDAKMIEMIKNEIMHKIQPMDWDDIAGLDYAKKIIQEAVIWPLLRPDIFTGLRRPVRGILLFGPPGTGKTLIGKCIASQSESTFFSISASSLTSKWVGEGEKMVRALFAVAVAHQPSVIFIDEVDSLLCQRSESEHESSRRIKTEFLVQLDGARTSENERILVVGATNRPQELDEAARRRFVRRLYIPLPEFQARYKMLENLLASVHHILTDEEVNEITKLTDGYSGADMEILCKEASMEPVRSIPPNQIKFFNTSQLRPIIFQDFELALKQVRASVSQDDLKQYIDWNNIYGSSNIS